MSFDWNVWSIYIQSNVFISFFVPSAMFFLISVLSVSVMSSSLFSSPVSILMVIALNSLTYMILTSVSLRSLPWPYLILSFVINFSVSSFYLPLCVYFCGLRTFSAFESSDFMKSRSWSALQDSVPVYQEQALQQIILCFLLTSCCCVWVTFLFSAVVYPHSLPVVAVFALWDVSGTQACSLGGGVPTGELGSVGVVLAIFDWATSPMPDLLKLCGGRGLLPGRWGYKAGLSARCWHAAGLGMWGWLVVHGWASRCGWAGGVLSQPCTCCLGSVHVQL